LPVSGSRDKRKERCQEDGEAETAYCVKQRRDKGRRGQRDEDAAEIDAA